MNTTPSHQPPVKDESTAEKAVAQVIAEHPFLSGLAKEHLELLTQNAMRMRYEPGCLIFREGDPANRFYLIESGSVALETANRDGRVVPVETIGAGGVVGWSWLFPPYYWHFDARVLAPTTVIFFYGTRLSDECQKDHHLGYELMRRMAQVVIQRLQATRKQLLSGH